MSHEDHLTDPICSVLSATQALCLSWLLLRAPESPCPASAERAAILILSSGSSQTLKQPASNSMAVAMGELTLPSSFCPGQSYLLWVFQHSLPPPMHLCAFSRETDQMTLLWSHKVLVHSVVAWKVQKDREQHLVVCCCVT